MNISQIKGFKYPDIELVRWFFKQSFDKLKNAKVLEFASHNGNNLSLFANYDYECIGVELNETNYKNAIYNFTQIMNYKKFNFYHQDMQDFAKEYTNINADIFLIPNVINYISKESFKLLLQNSRKNHLYKWGEIGQSFFFLRARSTKDHRYGLGTYMSDGSFILDKDEFSGEKGCLCTAYQEYELVEILQEYINLHDFEVITSENINIKNKVFIKDSDIIVYGKIK